MSDEWLKNNILRPIYMLNTPISIANFEQQHRNAVPKTLHTYRIRTGTFCSSVTGDKFWRESQL
jgi:hypothetical protein